MGFVSVVYMDGKPGMLLVDGVMTSSLFVRDVAGQAVNKRACAEDICLWYSLCAWYRYCCYQKYKVISSSVVLVSFLDIAWPLLVFQYLIFSKREKIYHSSIP